MGLFDPLEPVVSRIRIAVAILTEAGLEQDSHTRLQDDSLAQLKGKMFTTKQLAKAITPTLLSHHGRAVSDSFPLAVRRHAARDLRR